MLKSQVFICIFCLSLFYYANSTFITNSTTESTGSGEIINDVVVEIDKEILAVRQKIQNAINKSDHHINFTFLQDSFTLLHSIVLHKINQSDTLNLTSFNDLKTLTANLLMTFNLVIERVDLSGFSTTEKSAILTSILEVYKDYSRVIGSHLKSFEQTEPRLSFYSTYVQFLSQQFCPKHATAVVFTFHNRANQTVELELPISGITSPDREENITVTIVVSFLQEKYTFLNVKSPLLSITIDNLPHVILQNGHQFNFT